MSQAVPIRAVAAEPTDEHYSFRVRAIQFLYDKRPVILTTLGLLLIWQVGVTVFNVPVYMAPSPIDIIGAFQANGMTLWRNTLPTLLEASLGFIVGNLVAILLAVWFVHSPTAERAVYPIAVFVKAIPIIAVAPILVLIFGNGLTPKIIIAGLICFFPTLVNMVQGLKSASPAMLDLMRVLSASPSEVLWKVRLPSALPFLFAALKIAATSCVMGAIVAEWIGSTFGLGALIIDSTYNFRSPLLYATVVVAAMLAVAIFSMVSFVERRVIRWKPVATQ
ncbi:MAG: ABC transporter permease [Devosia sp.]|jgi:NitT/TauT family transport system permease protein